MTVLRLADCYHFMQQLRPLTVHVNGGQYIFTFFNAIYFMFQRLQEYYNLNLKHNCYKQNLINIMSCLILIYAQDVIVN